MTDNQNIAEIAVPNPDLKPFDRLIGTWKLSGETDGETTYEWMEGGFFLIQRVDLLHAGNHTKGMEIIGHPQNFGEDPSAEIKSRYFDNHGVTFDYVYEMEGDTLTIWGGQKGSPAYYKGTFSADGDTLAGEWVYPGGGYSSTATRVK